MSEENHWRFALRNDYDSKGVIKHGLNIAPPDNFMLYINN
jgi:hypothetical protein